jgi:hypothetical protein
MQASMPLDDQIPHTEELANCADEAIGAMSQAFYVDA